MAKPIQRTYPSLSRSQSKRMFRHFLHKRNMRYFSTLQKPLQRSPYVRFQNAIMKLFSNPLLVLVLFCRTAYNLYHGNGFEVVYSLGFIISILMVTALLNDWAMQIPWLKKSSDIFWSDDQRIQEYWQRHLQPVVWFFRLSYLSFGALAFWNISSFFESYELGSKGVLVPIELGQAQTVLAGMGFGFGGFISTALAEFILQISVVHMVPEIASPFMQNCRYCIDKFGKATVICVGGPYMAHDIPFLQNTFPVDAARTIMGKPLFESTTGHMIYANLRPLVESGEIDITLITDPKTGRVSDDLMIQHCKTTYRKLITERCAPGFAAAYSSPEGVLSASIKNMSTDAVKSIGSWSRKTFGFSKK